MSDVHVSRRRVREMRGLQLLLVQVALRCAKDLDLVRCVGDLGHAVSPTGGVSRRAAAAAAAAKRRARSAGAYFCIT